MSGICGVIWHERDYQLEQTDLQVMLQAVGGGALTNGQIRTFGPVGFGVHPLLGYQAAMAESVIQGRSVALALYGNVYNLREVAFAQGDDPNPLLGLLFAYQKEGMAFVQRLRGEFALALWDGTKETLYLATDRFRVHPLFYYCDHEKMVFASRLQSLMTGVFPLDLTVNPQAVVDVVASSVIPTPKTIFQEIKKLPPGYILTLRRKEIQLKPYWEVNFLSVDARPEAELARELKKWMLDAVSVRFEEDGSAERVGTFLSGGVDSSTVTGVLTQLAKRPIKSFSIGFDEQRFNEISYARIAARAFSAEHHEYFVTPQDVYDAIPVLLAAFAEPFANASAVPTYFCAKFAREHGVEVLYAGDGGDELFAGNERYAVQKLFDYPQRIPSWLREFLVKPLIFSLADGVGGALFMKAKKYWQRASIPYPQRLSSYGFFKLVPLAEVFADNFLHVVGENYDPYEAINAYYYQAPAKNELDRQLYIDLKLAISDNDLFKVTYMTEAAGVTVRFPFLDQLLAEFAVTVPAGMKMRGRELRSFFKKAYADLLPLEIRTKQKHGFGLPIPVWLRTDKRLNEMLHDLVLSPRSIQRGYFSKRFIEKLVENHKTDETSFYGTILWNLMILELWHRHWTPSAAVRSDKMAALG